MKTRYTIPFDEISIKDVDKVGGKNASLGEMIQEISIKGVQIPAGFATTSNAYWRFLDANNLREKLTLQLKQLDTESFTNLADVSKKVKSLLLEAEMPIQIQQDIVAAYRELFKDSKAPLSVAVRSSATAEDLPNASFAGQQDTFLNITGEDALLEACMKCFASLFSARAIKYRFDKGFDHMEVALSIGVQLMVRSDKGASGVAFTLEPETGFDKVIVVNGIWGLGENIVQGIVDPDEYIVFKPTLKKAKRSIISKKLGTKQYTMIYTDDLNRFPEITTTNVNTPEKKQNQFILSDSEVERLAEWCMIIEEHYETPMDIEWAKDGVSGQLYIVQARPETVHSIKENPGIIYQYTLLKKGKVLTKGISLGGKIATGRARVLTDPKDAEKLRDGEVLITNNTNPDWDPIMKKAAAIVTNKGGRTSHAAIVARELGVVAVVGCGDATQKICDGQMVTVSCAEGSKGIVYEDKLPWKQKAIDTRKIYLPRTEVMLILADPEKAFQYSFLPNDGVGLMRMEFVINNTIGIHPMALVAFDELEDEEAKETIEKLTRLYERKEDYFTDHLSQAVATVAAAFYPKDVIVRMSDFKSNEYAHLTGGHQFEPKEENPMIGFRGASRYYSPLYREGFRLECEAMKVVRDEMGLTNVKLMIPFCRTVDEGRKVIAQMEEYGLKRGVNDLEIYTMVEIPCNVILADQFAEVFDGFSIGSNDLTQLTLGLDRDSELVSSLFDENNEAVRRLISQVAYTARQCGVKIGLCGQAPSDFPEFARFLVNEGIDSISFNPDALIQGIENINKVERDSKIIKVKKEKVLTS